jgi:hypothetical protein
MEKVKAMEFATTMGMDALRICTGIKPRTHSLEEVIRWMRAMASPPPTTGETKP